MTLRSVGASLSVLAVLAAQSSAPDLILAGGRVYTLDPARPWAEAVAVRGDRIVGVGTAAEMRQTAGASTRVIDLKGAFVTPGFNDGHVDAIGDKAVRMLLDIYERVLTQEKLLGTDHRWRVIHAQVLYPGDAARFGELGLVAEVNPYHLMRE